MKRILPSALLGGFLATGALGCQHTLYYSSHGVHRYERGSEAGVFLAGGLVGAALVAAATAPDPDPEPVYHFNGYYGPWPVTPRSTRDDVKEDDELPAFDPLAARAALNGVDVSRCREAGAPVGFGHAKVMVNPDGRISKVMIDAPPAMSAAAEQCVGNAIGQATVPPFRGSLVTIGTTYHVSG